MPVYLLPLVPLAADPDSAGIADSGRGWRIVLTLITVIAMLLTLGAANARRLRHRRRSGCSGVDQFTAQIAALPADSVVHQFWLDWHLGYYMGDPTARRCRSSFSHRQIMYRYLMAVLLLSS
ncbi:MAG: hypothetical protein U0528_07680 [Anaerolineae bacterium]